MKFTATAALLASTNAMRIRNKAEAAETCSSSFERVNQQKDFTLKSSFVTSNMHNGKFEDPSFGPNSSSLYSEALQSGDNQFAGQVRAYQGVEQQYGIAWKRPEEITGHKVSLWGKEGISVKISEQGYDGDCWFLSSASALAAYPERVKAMFPGQNEYSDNGAFQVRLFVRGEPVNVIVDDRLPAYNISRAMGYVENYPLINDQPSKAGAYWLTILEKAMAKLNVNYTGINGGHPGQAMRYMTGMPTVDYYSNQMTDDQLWDHVNWGLSHDYNMGAACQVSHFNMVSGHAYGVIDAVELKGGAHDGQKLILMRNPWGNNKYDGPWSENDSRWTDDYRKQAASYGTANIGEFWIPLNQWRADYVSLTLNYYDPDWQVNSQEGTKWEWRTQWGDLNSWQTIDNPVAQDVLFECVQNERRLFANHTCSTDDTPLDFAYILFDQSLNQIEGTSGGVGYCDGGALNYHNLPAGKYQIRMINQDGDNGHNSLFKFKTYSKTAAVSVTQQKGNTYVYQ